MKKQSWYNIIHAAGDNDGNRAEILIYGEIGLDWFGEGISAETLVQELSGLDVANIDVRINSIGGQVFEGLAIFNALDRHPAKVTTHIDGMAASIASIVALAGDEVIIAENAFMMIHNAWGIEIGDARAMLKKAEILSTLDGGLADTYAAKTGETPKAIRVMMDAETWFNSEEALAVGLVDEVSARMEIAASFNLKRFSNVRPDVLERTAADHFETAALFRSASGDDKPPPAKKPDVDGAGGPSPADLVQLAAETELAHFRTLL